MNSVVKAPTPLSSIDLADDAQVAEVLDLAVRAGEVVLASGTGVLDTTTTVRLIATTYGLSRCSIDVTYDAIRIWADRGPELPPASAMRVVHDRSLNFTSLAAVNRLSRRLRTGMVPLDEARAALDVTTPTPHPYRDWIATVARSLMATAIAALLGAGVIVAAISFATTVVIDRLNRVLDGHGLPIFFQHVLGGAIATVPAIVLASLTTRLQVEVNPTLIIAAGITVLLSGLQLVGAVQDAITGAPVTAMARMLEVLMMTGGIIAGIALTLRIAYLIDVTVPPVSFTSGRDITDLPVKIAAGAVAAMAFALACYAERRALVAAACSGAAGTVCFLLVKQAGFGPVISSGVAATLVGLAGGLTARRALTPPLVIAVAGITPLLPGLRLYRGLYSVIHDELLAGADQLLAAGGIGCALAAGVTLGEWFARTRRPNIMQSGAPRRPITNRRSKPAD